MSFSEAQFQTKFLKWLRANWTCNSVFELKLTKTKSIPFSALKEHQRHALLQASQNKIAYKIPDEGISQKPFDCFFIKNAWTYVVVMFYTRGCKTFYMIEIEDWIEEEKKARRKSLTKNRANEIGDKYELK